MKVLYALFQEPGVAETALRALKSSGLTEDECRVFVHKDRPSPALRTSESDTRHGLFIGLMAGAVGGALMGWLLTGPLGLLRLPMYSAMAFLMFLGMICGLLGGGLSGTGLVHSKLHPLVESFRPGQTLITAEAESQQSVELVYRILRLHGAIAVSD